VRETGPFWDEIYERRKLQGTVLHSFDAWLLIRGMRTLFLRVEKATANALAIARHFEGHEGLEAVLYPGLPSHPDHAVAKAPDRRALWRHDVGHCAGALSRWQ